MNVHISGGKTQAGKAPTADTQHSEEGWSTDVMAVRVVKRMGGRAIVACVQNLPMCFDPQTAPDNQREDGQPGSKRWWRATMKTRCSLQMVLS